MRELNRNIKAFGRKLGTFFYEVKVRTDDTCTIEKYKILKITWLKVKRVSNVRVEYTYAKLFHRVQRLNYLDLSTDFFEALDRPVKQKEPMVSIIVPNYNHASYLRERLDSIYRQTYTDYEVILLDDASTDDSVEILSEYACRYPHNTRLVLNEQNSGKVFHQWNKGLSLAKGEYIWIAESDDYCDADFLERVTEGLRHQSVMLAFARSVFVEKDKVVGSQEQYLSDLPLSWEVPFLMPAHTLVNKGFAVKNLIPNVSSAVFRNVGMIPPAITSQWARMQLCGDWLFYLWLIEGGSVYYTNRTNNYYRIHEGSTSQKVQKTLRYYEETHEISCYVARHFAVHPTAFCRVRETLIGHCKMIQNGITPQIIKDIYDLKKIEACARERKPNIGICCYSLMQGGGEIFPIHLANELKRQGYPVTFVDFRRGVYDPVIRHMLHPDVPLVEFSELCYLPELIASFGIEVMHSHEASVDRDVARTIKDHRLGCKQVVTLHGSYEVCPSSDLIDTLSVVPQTCSCFVYISDKNLEPLYRAKPMAVKKIGNGLPDIPLTPHRRAELGIGEEAFCVTVVSRALFEKGWLEAVEAVKLANETSSIPIHLLLIGSGECYDALRRQTDLPPYIHLLGRRSDVRNYFAMSDVALLPSRFKGESFPLAVIESLMSGTPVIASNVGEVPHMLADEQGNRAGVLFDLDDWQVPVDKLARILVDLSSDKARCAALRSQARRVGKRFDITSTAKKYVEVYQEALAVSCKPGIAAMYIY